MTSRPASLPPTDDDLRQAALAANSPDRDDVAIVGMSCVFPGADTPGQFWRNIVGKVDCVTDPPPDWQPEYYLDQTGKNPNPVYTGRGGYLGDLCRFNAAKYGIMPNSVEGAEPDHFIALRCAYEALADAGYPEIPINPDKTGVILGRGVYLNRGMAAWMLHGWLLDQTVDLLRQLEPHRSEQEFQTIRAELKKNIPPVTAETVPGLTHSILAGRIANRLDLKGPAYTVDAACASTLLAFMHGMNELHAGHCDAVIVGGVQVSTPGMVDMAFCFLDALSRSGKISPFSAQANGTLLGQGCGVLVLKRRRDAERDGNRIYALCKSIGMASDGKGTGLLAPRQGGQELSVRRAYEQAGLSPQTVELIEAHGTGIPLGDGTEIKSLTACFGPRQGELPTVAMGSVKSMISHLIPASGSASLIKTALALYHRQLPPTLHAEHPNPALGLDKTPFFLNTEPRPWIHGRTDAPRRAAVDAFGFGGINAHAVLEEHPAANESALPRLDGVWPCEVVVVSAQTKLALQSRCKALAEWWEKGVEVEPLDFAASVARENGECRLAMVVSGRTDGVKKLRHAAKLLGEPNRDKIQDRSGVFWYAEPLGKHGRTALVFPGEGAQYPHMLADLCRQFPEVRREFDLADTAFLERPGGQALSRVIFPLPDEAAQAEAKLLGMGGAVTSVTLAGRALKNLLDYLGVQADAVVGHSSGEFGALMAAGCFGTGSDEELIRVVREGADNAQRLLAAGLVPDASLIAVGGVDPAAVAAVLAQSQGKLRVAMDNCPNQLVLVGDPDAADAAVESLRGKGGMVEKLAWGRAYHTPDFAPACPIVQEYFDSVNLKSPQLQVWSCATAAPFPEDPLAVRDLAVLQWRSPVRFRETVLAMHEAGVRVFIEVGPRGNLATFVSDTLGKAPHVSVPIAVQKRDGLTQLCRALAQLIAHGVGVQLDKLYERRLPKHYDLTAPAPVVPRDPRLPLELPELRVSAKTAEKWHKADASAETKPAPAPTSPPAAGPPPPVAVPLAVASPAPSPIKTPPVAPSPVTVPTASRAPALPAAAPAAIVSAGPTAGDPRQRALAEFQNTMRQFLETQQAVTLARLGTGPTPTAPPAAHGSASPALLPSPQPAHTPPPQSPIPLASPAPIGAHVAAAPARIPAPASSASPSAEASARLRSAPTAQPIVSATGAATAVAEHLSLTDRLMSIVSERTGYPVEMLDLDANMEADLGIDSIKRVEIVGAFRRAATPNADAPPDGFMEQMATARTLRAILDGMSGAVSGNGHSDYGYGDHGYGGNGAAKPDAPTPAARKLPLVERIVERDGDRRLVAECTFDLARHPFLKDHTFFAGNISQTDPALHPLAIMPLAMMLELMAETAVELCPEGGVQAVCDVETRRWLSFETPRRTVRMEAERQAAGKVRVRVVATDGDGAGAIICEGTVELGDAPSSLSPARVPDTIETPCDWGGSVYGHTLFHGPAFQGIRSLDRASGRGMRATVVEPDRALLIGPEQSGAFVLPVALVDAASQAAGLIYGNWNYSDPEVTLVFPHRLARLEFLPRPQSAAALTAISSADRRGPMLHSEVELISPSGEVVLRMSGRSDHVSTFPTGVYHYPKQPLKVTCNREITDLFSDQQQITGCTIVETNLTGTAALLNRLWANVLSHLALNADERRRVERENQTPGALAAWLLGRVAVKDAVRIHRQLSLCLADVAIDSDGAGRPIARVPGQAAPRVSLAHKELHAVAAAVDETRWAGVGIDLERLQTLDAGLIEDAFTTAERALIAGAAEQSGEPVENWCVSAWGAKEALGKALGRGVLGGPLGVQIAEIDAACGGLRLTLHGKMEEAFGKTGGSAPYWAWRRLRSPHVVVLCLLAREETGSENH